MNECKHIPRSNDTKNDKNEIEPVLRNINDNDDPKQNKPKNEHKTFYREVHRNVNSDESDEESKPEPHNTDSHLVSSSQTSELKKEAHQEQPVLSDVEQQALPLEKYRNLEYRTLQKKPSSLERRRLPVDILLKPGNSITSSVDELQMEEDDLNTSESPGGFLRATCLNPKYSLRTQLLLTFGSASALIIASILIASVIITWNSGERLKSINEANFEDLIRSNEAESARILALSLTTTLIQEEAVRVLHDSVRDRFAGYPNNDDRFVPFFDIDSQTNKYPVVGVTGKLLPLDWQIDSNVNNDNHKEHVQDRWSWYDTEPALSTAQAFYIMQGMCDPSVTDPSAFTYWENCTGANNDVSTGGVVTPSHTNNQIYRKASALSPILKALYESHQDIYALGIFFSNGGAGAGLNFPHYQLRTSFTYTSIGCEWMNTPNPYDTSRPIGTKDEIAKCRPKDTTVSSRSYNNLERGWCRDQALNPFKPIVEGPFLDAWKNQLVVSIGQGVYDRITNNFIGCIFIRRYLDNMEKILLESGVTHHSEVSVVIFDDGTTLASTAWKSSATDAVKIYDLNVGLTFESYEKLKTLVDYNTTWDPTEVREMYETFTLKHDGFLAAIHPIPAVPNLYDPHYIPLFFVMLSTTKEDIFRMVEDEKQNVDMHVTLIMYVSLAVGIFGLGMVLLIIYLMSKALTAPLEYMNAAANEIINHFGHTTSSKKTTLSIHETSVYYCYPKTELHEIVKDFNAMVTSFDFSSATNPFKGGCKEIPNGVNMKEDWYDLYESRKMLNFGYKVRRIGSGATNVTQFKNLGRNLSCKKDTQSRAQKPVERAETQGEMGSASRLFFWTVLLIGTPLLLTTVAISGTVVHSMSNQLHSSIEVTKSLFLDVNRNGLSVRVHAVSTGTVRPMRDLYLLTRYMSWLLFGAVERAESFTEMITGAERCKNFSDNTECPFYQENYFCGCAGNSHEYACSNDTFETHSQQHLFFTCEASDTFPNGDRNSTSFPNVSYTPQSTKWWDDVRTLPGSEKGALASGYETTYDRLRVISASPLHPVEYNAYVQNKYTLANSIAFEADGLFIQFDACSNMFLDASNWSSTKANGAYELRPELCPLGKFGYDPRCTAWYDTGKRLAEVNGTPLHVSPPYVLADSRSTIGQSVTSPLIDPQTKEHIGQAMVSFISGPLLDSIGLGDDGHFPIVITTSSGPDSVIGPGFSLLNESARPISELVLPYDHTCNEMECKLHRDHFNQIVASMKKGKSGNTNFTRTSSTGSTETVYIAYAPFVQKFHRPVDSSDFSRGVESHEVFIYSLALVQTEGDLLQQFEDVREDNNEKVRISIILLLAMIVLPILFTIYVMRVVTLLVVGPMLLLHNVIRSINRLDMNEESSIVNRSNGSRELNSFSDTIQTLYKIARCGNYAFLSGDLERAYTVMYDALRLFRRLDNNKAVGVVSNNLGNLLIAVFRVMNEANEEHFCGMTKLDVINKGISFFYEAIQLGEDIYDEYAESEGLSPNCLDFMQHLSNRYFNRGVFLLAVKDEHSQPGEMEKLGYRDIDIASDLDAEIAGAGLKGGRENVVNTLKKFEVASVRAEGYLMLQEMGFPDTWDVEDMLDDTFMMVKKEAKKDANSLLFETTTVVGRLQEIETQLIRYRQLKGELRLAAQIGIRMLVEDEYIFTEAQQKAMEAVSVYIDESVDIDKDNKNGVEP